MTSRAESQIEEKLEYTDCWWGEIIRGTKAQLQSLGLGLNNAFPGEPNGPKRIMHLVDPRGLPLKISKWHSGTYAAYIHYPDRSIPEFNEWVDFAPGVRLRKGCSDEYVGRAGALDAAGIVKATQLPGQPGMRKFFVTIFADGSIPGSVTKWNRHHEHVGAKRIQRHSKNSFHVSVTISPDEFKRRQPHFLRQQALISIEQKRFMAMPRPPRLSARSGVFAQHRLTYATDTAFQSFRAKLFNPLPLNQEAGDES